MRIPARKIRGALLSGFCFIVVSTLISRPYTAFQDIWWEATKDLGKLHLPRMVFKSAYMLGKGIGFLLPLIAALLIYYWVACRHRPDGHTRCGKCAYILKGLQEPRCPECGTRI